ncbi:MAG: type III pantothenate kinase [Phycisphaerae bacterium]
MDINLLTISLGNSRLAMAVFAAGELVYETHLTLEQRADWPGAIREAWKHLGTDDADVAVASVNPALEPELTGAVVEAAGRTPQFVGREIDLPMKLLTKPPEATGVDRVCALAAAYEQLGKACVVVDAGTAVTIDAASDAGDFVGGAILPGLGMMLDALHQRTAKLPAVDFKPPEHAVGQNTEDAIRSGVFHAIRGAVRDVVEQYALDHGSWPEVIATGGDAAKLFADWDVVHAISPPLLHYGIAKAYADHHINHAV